MYALVVLAVEMYKQGLVASVTVVCDNDTALRNITDGEWELRPSTAHFGLLGAVRKWKAMEAKELRLQAQRVKAHVREKLVGPLDLWHALNDECNTGAKAFWH
jgi:hypothetical protein